MKNAIKKVVAVAMAFTLLGTGTTIAKTVNPKSVTTLSAHAACKHNTKRVYTDDWKWIGNEPLDIIYDNEWYSRPYKDKCSKCGKTVGTGTYYRYRKVNVWLWWDTGDWYYTYSLPF